MSTSFVMRVVYHFETGGKRVSETFSDHIVASAMDAGTIATVLSNNSKTNNGQGKLVIDSVINSGAGSGLS